MTFSLVLYHFSNLARSHIMLRSKMFHNFILKYPKLLVPSPCAVSPPKCNTGSCSGRWLLCVVPVSNSLLTWLASCCCPARAHRTLNHCSCYITIYFCVTANIFFSVSSRYFCVSLPENWSQLRETTTCGHCRTAARQIDADFFFLC